MQQQQEVVSKDSPAVAVVKAKDNDNSSLSSSFMSNSSIPDDVSLVSPKKSQSPEVPRVQQTETTTQTNTSTPQPTTTTTTPNKLPQPDPRTSSSHILSYLSTTSNLPPRESFVDNRETSFFNRYLLQY